MGPLEALMTPEDSNGTVIAGMAKEFLDFLRTLDSGARAVEDTTGYCASIVPYDAETMKFALLKFLQHYDVTVLTEATLEEVRPGLSGWSAALWWTPPAAATPPTWRATTWRWGMNPAAASR